MCICEGVLEPSDEASKKWVGVQQHGWYGSVYMLDGLRVRMGRGSIPPLILLK